MVDSNSLGGAGVPKTRHEAKLPLLSQSHGLGLARATAVCFAEVRPRDRGQAWLPRVDTECDKDLTCLTCESLPPLGWASCRLWWDVLCVTA